MLPKLKFRSLRRSAAAGLVLLSLAGFTAKTASAADIVDTAVSAGHFKTLVAALQAAGLVDPGPTPSSRPRTKPSPSCRRARSTI
jgi:hypothetical protein